LFVVVRQVWFDRDVFSEFGFGAVVILLPVVGESKTKMYERQCGIRGGGEFQLGDGFVHFFAVEVGFAEDEVKFGSLAADFNQTA